MDISVEIQEKLENAENSDEILAILDEAGVELTSEQRQSIKDDGALALIELLGFMYDEEE